MGTDRPRNAHARSSSLAEAQRIRQARHHGAGLVATREADDLDEAVIVVRLLESRLLSLEPSDESTPASDRVQGQSSGATLGAQHTIPQRTYSPCLNPLHGTRFSLNRHLQRRRAHVLQTTDRSSCTIWMEQLAAELVLECVSRLETA
jgi:hypothetical protein